MTKRAVEALSVPEFTLYAFLSIDVAPFSKAVSLGQAWEWIQILEMNDFDSDVWDNLEWNLKGLKLIEDEAVVWKHIPSTWDEPEDWDLLDTVVEQKLAEYKTLLMEYVFHVEED